MFVISMRESTKIITLHISIDNIFMVIGILLFVSGFYSLNINN